MIELQVQLENVDHLRAKDTSLCRRLDLLRQPNGIQPPLPGDPIHLGQRCIEGQMGIEAGGGAGQQGGDPGFRLRRNLLIYGVGGLIVPFIGIKLIDLVITGLGLV